VPLWKITRSAEVPESDHASPGSVRLYPLTVFSFKLARYSVSIPPLYLRTSTGPASRHQSQSEGALGCVLIRQRLPMMFISYPIPSSVQLSASSFRTSQEFIKRVAVSEMLSAVHPQSPAIFHWSSVRISGTGEVLTAAFMDAFIRGVPCAEGESVHPAMATERRRRSPKKSGRRVMGTGVSGCGAEKCLDPARKENPSPF